MTKDERETLAREAAEWLIANRDEPDPARQAAFVAWLKISPAHAQAYSDALKMAGDLRRILPQPLPSIERLLEPEPNVTTLAPRSARRWPYALAAAVVPLVALLSVWISHRPAAPVTVQAGEHFATGHGQQLAQRLADGSVLHLNTDTAVTVRYQPASRRVELERGQVIFEVVHDAARPFQVIAGRAQVTAVGTQFDVYLQNEATTVVTVLEGKVTVGTSISDARAPLLVGAGEQVRVVRGVLPAEPSAVDPSRSTAWLRRQISFRHEPLAQVVTEFNRYASTPIQIDSKTLGDMPVSGVFNVDDTESMIAFLRSLPGVEVEISAGSIRVSAD
ncbi:MAG: FecR domain-containing protein [Proteobacteria bacterium]|nr:FecR domain-containing protein [Pseudomonadota bacterium]